MSARVRRAAQAFAREWRLHEDGAPVELSRLHERFTPVYVDLSTEGIVGAGMFVEDDQSGIALGRILIASSLSDAGRRLVYAHELGHFAAGHMASPVTSSLNSWQHDRDEREAWLAAAVLLIPTSAVRWGENVDEIAARCRVPVALAQMFHQAMAVR